MFSNQIKSKLTDSKKDEVPAEFEEMHPKINSFLLVIHLLLHDCISTHMSLNIYGSNRNDILSHYMFLKISQEKTKYVEQRFFKFFSSPLPPYKLKSSIYLGFSSHSSILECEPTSSSTLYTQ